jgi:large subunit ribosomal protein L35
MPKLKVHRGAKKRIVVTKTGKVMHRHPSGNHFLQKKRSARKRQYAGLDQLTGKSAMNMKKKLGV